MQHLQIVSTSSPILADSLIVILKRRTISRIPTMQILSTIFSYQSIDYELLFTINSHCQLVNVCFLRWTKKTSKIPFAFYYIELSDNHKNFLIIYYSMFEIYFQKLTYDNHTFRFDIQQ